ncbi:MAG: hypothetical protein QOE34_1348 [Verrucomicrobiota bacterium]
MARDARFWRNVTIIAVAHIAVIIALVRWNRQTQKTNLASVIWMNGEVAALASPAQPEPTIEATPAPKIPLSTREKPEEPLPETSVKSDIQLPASGPSPTPVATPSREPTTAPTPAPKASAKPTEKPAPKPTPKKAAETKATPKPSPKKNSTPSEHKKKNDAGAKPTVKVAPANANRPGEKSDSIDGNAAAQSSEFRWYGKMLHDRFHSEWLQPTTSVVVGAKMSALVRIRIEKDGRISKFTIVKPSGNVVVDESVAAVARRVTQVDPLPGGLSHGAYYEVNINFELNPEP